MSSVGQAIGGVVGGVIGFFTGGPTGALYGAQIGMGVGGLIDPPKGPNINGPRLSDLSVQTSTYGVPIPRVYGTIATHGNVIWLENDKLKEVATKTKQGGKGGPSATTTTYSYYATFAVGLCKGPIAGVRRIWVGANLIYDAGADDLESIIASNEAAQGFALYLGTEDQQPDPRMQADLGVADCPAYRGLAYIVFYDLALKDYGNSLQAAQVKVEVLKVQAIEPWGRRVTIIDTGVDFATWTTTGAGLPYIRTADDGVARIGVVNSYTEYVIRKSSGAVKTAAQFVPMLASPGNVWNACGMLDGEHLWALSYSDTPSMAAVLGYGTAAGSSVSITRRIDHAIPQDRPIFGVAIANDGRRALVMSGDVGSNPYAGGVVSDGVWTLIDAYGGVISSGSIDPVHAYEFGFSRGARDGFGHYGVSSFDFESMQCVSIREGVVSLWEIDGEGLLRAIETGIMSFTNYGYASVYLKNGIVYAVSQSHYNIFASGVALPGLAQLAEIIESESLQSGVLTTFDVDTSAIDQSVRGYRVAQVGAIRGALEPLQAAWPFDALQSGYKLAFRPRGPASVASIPADQLDARPASEAPGTQLTIAREMDTQLPRRVVVRYLDTTREYDISEQAGERLNTDSIHLRDVELPIVLTATEAAGMAEVLLYLYWLERREVSFRLPPSYRYIEPADVITVTGEWGQYELRLVTVHLLSDGRIECQARYNTAALYTPTAQGEEGSSTPKPIALAGPSYYALLDIPLLRDEDDAAGLPAAMAGYTTGWPGGILFRSPDDGQTWTALQGFDGPATLGFARTALAAGRTDIIDASSVLQVDLLAGALESVTELAMLSGANYFALGADGRWEIIAARTCELQADGSYILRDFLRGRAGTEWAMSTHQAGDILVLLTDPDLAWIGMDAASIGLARDYRGITSGRTIDSDEDRAFTYRAVNLEPLSPVYLNGSRHPTTGDWSISWIRRGRVSPSWRNSVDVPLGEASEAYEVEIYASSSYTTVKRTIGVTAASASYTSAQQVADFGANQGTLYLRIYQLSATVGRGYPLQTSITR